MIRALLAQKLNKFYPSNSLVEPVSSSEGDLTRSQSALREVRHA